MKPRGVPPISAIDLRDHADDARIQRIWERVERDLGVPRARPVRRREGRMWVALAAASFGAFVGGVWVGLGVDGDEPPAQAEASLTGAERVTVDVFAAGSEARSYDLPGGGAMTLEPGTMVEIAHTDDTVLTLRLLRGGASVDLGSGTSVRASGLSIVAGEARVSSAAGSALRVRRNEADVDVSVAGGVVDVFSPAGARRLSGGQRLDGVPLFSRTSSLVDATPKRVNGSGHPLALNDDDQDIEEEPIEVADVEPLATRDWLALYNDNNWSGARAALQAQSGGIAAALSSAHTANELLALSDLVPAERIALLERVVLEFPGSPYAGNAASSLVAHYEGVGRFELAQRYKQFVPQQIYDPSVYECRKLELMAPETAEAIATARNYLAKFPEGECEELAQSIVANAPEPSAPSEEDSEEPPESKAPLPPPLQDEGTYDE